MDENTEVLFQGWCLHFKGNEKENYRLRNPWKKRYFVFYQTEDGTQILLYDRRQKTGNHGVAKDIISLQSRYKIAKLFAFKGQQYVCRVSTFDQRYLIAFTEEKLFHSFAFLVQSQTKLREELEDECFIVRPDNSVCHQCIGARGNMCLLHISQYGVILALQLSKCILAWWPLKSIKWYESYNRQQFGLEAGPRAPMGAGVYVFNTRGDQDNQIFDRLDNYVMEAAGLRQIIMMPPRRSRDDDDDDDSVTTSTTTPRSSLNSSSLNVDGEWDSLQTLARVDADPRFNAQLQRISRNIYDQLASKHFGGGGRKISQTRLSAESRLSDHSELSFPSSVSQRTLERNDHSNGASGSSSSGGVGSGSTAPIDIQPRVMTSPSSSSSVSSSARAKQSTSSGGGSGGSGATAAAAAAASAHAYANSEVERDTMTSRKMKQQNMTSAYLSMSPPSSQASAALLGMDATTSQQFHSLQRHQQRTLNDSQTSGATMTPPQPRSLQRLPKSPSKTPTTSANSVPTVSYKPQRVSNDTTSPSVVFNMSPLQTGSGFAVSDKRAAEQHPFVNQRLPVSSPFNGSGVVHNTSASCASQHSGNIPQQNSVAPEVNEPQRPESFPRGERAVSNQYVEQYEIPVNSQGIANNPTAATTALPDTGNASSVGTRFARQSNVSSASDPPTPYERMSASLDDFVYAPDSEGSNYPAPYAQSSPVKRDKLSGLYSYAAPRDFRLLNSNVAPRAGASAGAAAVVDGYSYANKMQQPHVTTQTRDLKPISLQQQHTATSVDVTRPPLMLPAHAASGTAAMRPKDLYAKPKLKSNLRKSMSNPDLLQAQTADLDGVAGARAHAYTYEDFETVREDVYESPLMTPQTPPLPADTLAFANNMFKDELDAARSPQKGQGHLEGQQAPPVIKPKPVLKMSLFSRSSANQRAEQSARALSISPVSPGAVGASPRITTNTKSFKRAQPTGENSSGGSMTARSVGRLDATTSSSAGAGGGGVSRPPLSSSLSSHSNNSSVFRSTSRDSGGDAPAAAPASAGSVTSPSSALLREKTVKNVSMEGRRLPSLPADAILGGGGVDVGGDVVVSSLASGDAPGSPDEQYERVGGTGTYC